jgi:predicted enzyme related to lactoylglutathione lyase
MTKNAMNFFEIPTLDLDRAVAFYQKVFNCQFRMGTLGETKIAMFVVDGITGALVQDKARQPQNNGTVVYLDAGGDIDGCISRIREAGGKMVVGRKDLGRPGYIALFHDTEGNIVGIHTPKPASRSAQPTDELDLEQLDNVSGGILGSTPAAYSDLFISGFEDSSSGGMYFGW